MSGNQSGSDSGSDRSSDRSSDDGGRLQQVPRSMTCMSAMSTMSMGIEVMINRLFHKFDLDHNGTISAREWATFALAYAEANSHVALEDLDLDGNSVIDQNEWRLFWTSMIEKGRSEESIALELSRLMKFSPEHAKRTGGHVLSQAGSTWTGNMPGWDQPRRKAIPPKAAKVDFEVHAYSDRSTYGRTCLNRKAAGFARVRPAPKDPSWWKKEVKKFPFGDRSECGFLVQNFLTAMARSTPCPCEKAALANTGKQLIAEAEGAPIIMAGYRCQSPRCRHCEGSCGCDWKEPLHDLIREGVEINGAAFRGPTPLTEAAQKGQMRIVVFLLLQKACPLKSADRHGWTPLHEAAKHNRAPICEAILEDTREFSEDYDIYESSEAPAENRLKCLLEAKCKHTQNSTALIEAAQRGYVEVVELLLKFKANINVRCEDKSTALMLASGEGHLEMCQLLIRSGCRLCGGPGGKFRKDAIAHGLDVTGCKFKCKDTIRHVPLRNENNDSAMSLARSRTRDGLNFLALSRLFEKHGVR
eukprot:TRINITY_DN10290_c0_g1_i1.p1 TRINITY_DN10290_c0_g1~~TRINITY_DN10290_c0_g1_i1.p1  ORF type:complete len:529 (-),score=72.45 TRINITY_DN10290_c0_g1_i1:61-1647(-)